MNDIPRTLGDRYEVGEVLGRGGMAEVHAGRDTRLGRRVAIKMLRPDMARDPVFQARFRREAQSAAGLNHPAIVAVYDTGEDVYTDPTGASVRLPFIVMEHVEGRTVRDVLIAAGDHGVGTQRAVAITAGVLTALDYSHRQGIVHRDIKPANVMITPSGDIKVMDFGIARAMADTSATMTATSAVIGTAQYLSPEQARGETVDARSDLYSAGCLLYELLTGRPPFVGDSAVSVAYQHVREVPVPPGVLNPAVDDEMDRVVLKALAKDRDDRYDDAEQFRADLVAAEEGRPVRAPAVAVATATATHALPTRTEATRALASAGFAPSTDALPATATLGTPGTPGTPGTLTGPFPAQPEPPRRRRTGLVVLLVLLGLFVAGAAALGIYRAVEMNRQVAVPDVTQRTEAQARSQLEQLGFTHVTSKQVANPAAGGTVIGMSPPPPTKVDPAGPVVLTVSSGPAAVAVPNVEGLTETLAQQTLTRAGLVEGDAKTEANPDVPQGRVIRTDPAAGAPLPPGSPVTLVLSSGQVQLPDLRGEQVADAQAQLNALGLNSSTTTRASDQPPGTVLAQNPDPGLVDSDGLVQLVVAVAPPPPPATPSPTPTGDPTASPTTSPSGSSPSSSGSPSSSPSSTKTKGKEKG